MVYLNKATDDGYKVKKMMANGVCFMAGTTAPTEADIPNNELEGVAKAIDYFHEKGVAELHIEPKYMGSNVQLYLYKDLSQCKAFSRNGFLIKKDLTNVFQEHLWILDELDADEAIIQVELMPWSFMAGKLIDVQFKMLTTCVKKEISFIEENGFEKVMQDALQEPQYLEFLKDIENGMSSKEASKKYPRYETYKNLSEIEFSIQTEQDKKDILAYEKQVDIYAKDDVIHAKPFDLLRTVKNGVITTYWQERMDTVYEFLHSKNTNSMEKGLTVSLYDKDKAIKQVQHYFDELVKNNMEGIIVKPVYRKKDLIPAMKVRNKEYLRIIYGYDYLSAKKYEKMVKNKRCNKKRKLSVKEWQIGLQMLECTEKETMEKLMHLMLNEYSLETEVDNRL